MTAPVGLTALIPTFSEDVVAIFEQSDDGDDVQILEDAHLLRCSVDRSVTAFRHPLENARTLVDHRIINPVTIELQVILVDSLSLLNALAGEGFAKKVRDIYEQITEIFLAGTILSIQTRTTTYRNQLLQAMPHEETTAMFDGVSIQFSCEELQFETANVTFAPADETNSDTVDRGKQNPLEIAAETAQNVLEEARSIFGG